MVPLKFRIVVTARSFYTFQIIGVVEIYGLHNYACSTVTKIGSILRSSDERKLLSDESFSKNTGITYLDFIYLAYLTFKAENYLVLEITDINA